MTMQIDKSTIITPVGTLAFPSLIKPSVFKDVEKYAATLIFPAVTADDRKALMPLVAFAQSVFDAAHGPGAFKADETIIANLLRNGATKAGYTGFGEGTRFITMNSKFRPTLSQYDAATKAHSKVDKEDPDAVKALFYPGALCRAVVRAYTYGGKGKKDDDGTPIKAGVSLGLNGLEFVAHGKPLLAEPNDEDNIAALEAAPAPEVRNLPEFSIGGPGGKDAIAPAGKDDEPIQF